MYEEKKSMQGWEATLKTTGLENS